jgi:hypothetical protein
LFLTVIPAQSLSPRRRGREPSTAVGQRHGTRVWPVIPAHAGIQNRNGAAAQYSDLARHSRACGNPEPWWGGGTVAASGSNLAEWDFATLRCWVPAFAGTTSMNRLRGSRLRGGGTHKPPRGRLRRDDIGNPCEALATPRARLSARSWYRVGGEQPTAVGKRTRILPVIPAHVGIQNRNGAAAQYSDFACHSRGGGNPEPRWSGGTVAASGSNLAEWGFATLRCWVPASAGTTSIYRLCGDRLRADDIRKPRPRGRATRGRHPYIASAGRGYAGTTGIDVRTHPSDVGRMKPDVSGRERIFAQTSIRRSRHQQLISLRALCASVVSVFTTREPIQTTTPPSS